METLEKIEQDIKKQLSEKRYYHSICVTKQIEELAKIHNVDIEKAKLVGMLHDIAKEMKKEDKIEYAKQNNIYINDVEQCNVGLLHAKIGAHIAKTKYGFDEQMCNAIAAHTTGKENMDILAKLLYIADATGEDRNWEDVTYVKSLAKNNIDKAILYILDITIKENIEEGKLMHIDSILARNSILKNMYHKKS